MLAQALLFTEPEHQSETAGMPEGFRQADTLEAKIAATEETLFRLWREGWHCLIATSMGKDSSVMTSIVLNAAVKYQESNGDLPAMIVATGNTLLENPVVEQYAKRELEKVKAFAEVHNLPVRVEVATPSLSNNYLVNLIGGRTVATFPDNSGKCSDMMKVTPINRLKKRVFRELGVNKGAKVCTLVGKRYDESQARAENMKRRQERPDFPVLNERGERVLSAIAHFTLDDVFYYIGKVRSGSIAAYSDFDELVQVYRDSEGGECAVVAYMDGKSRNTGCGARHGCHICLRVQDDRSMENMLRDEKYKFMQPLSDFRQYLKACHYDWSRRNWLARTLNDDGTIGIAPNAYSPEFCEELLRYALTIDANEAEWAREEMEEPRFQLLRIQDVIAIDLLWNRYGYQHGLHACWLWWKVYVEGKRWYPPRNEPEYPSRTLPPTVNVPFADRHYDMPHAGFRDLSMMVIDQESPIVKGDKYVTNCNTGDEFEVDDEGAHMFFAWELEDAIERYHGELISPTAAFHYLVRLGVVVIHKGGHLENDRMLRVANQIWRSGIRDCLNDPIELVKRLGQKADKVSSSGMQLDLVSSF